jgi:MFS family permease
MLQTAFGSSQARAHASRDISIGTTIGSAAVAESKAVARPGRVVTAGEGAGGTRAGSIGQFIVLVAIAGLGPMAINIIVPSLPGIARDLGSDYGVTQLTLSLFLASMALFLVIAGPVADALGRRPVLFAGLSVFLAATIAAWMAPSIHVLIGARIAQAAGAGACAVISRAIIAPVASVRSGWRKPEAW